MSSPQTDPQSPQTDFEARRGEYREALLKALRTQGPITYEMVLKQQETMKGGLTQGAAAFRERKANQAMVKGSETNQPPENLKR